jgi:hypothetical protein
MYGRVTAPQQRAQPVAAPQAKARSLIHLFPATPDSAPGHVSLPDVPHRSEPALSPMQQMSMQAWRSTDDVLPHTT